MTIYYLDTSALVKYYVTEPGSVWIRQSLLNAAQAEGLKVENPFWHTDLDAPPSEDNFRCSACRLSTSSHPFGAHSSPSALRQALGENSVKHSGRSPTNPQQAFCLYL